ncbi:hypothetical protein L1987_57450 [Smallanthus sonchifolius]|uniref:Uncharacterized protein n=1 Tax=Smallanthus sonchifolius TaxID=185202 RepID=A0ACB9DDN6_9ASTR|nr:hypothetical protein L1987_57450 [Smallanthus sonchifolius]
MVGDEVEDGNSTLVCVDVDSGGELDEANASMLVVDVDSELHPEGFDVAVAETFANLIPNSPLLFIGSMNIIVAYEMG